MIAWSSFLSIYYIKILLNKKYSDNLKCVNLEVIYSLWRIIVLVVEFNMGVGKIWT